MLSSVCRVFNKNRLISLAMAILALYLFVHVAMEGVASGEVSGNDDAFISFRYARNFAAGHGLVYNKGERVEGYSNFLQVLLVGAGLLLAHPDHVYGISLIINITFGALAILALQYHSERRLPGSLWRFLPAILLATTPRFVDWTHSGLEVPMIVFVQTLLLIGAAKLETRATAGELVFAGGAIVFSILARPDGFLIPFLVVVYLFAKGQRKNALVCLGVAIAAISMYFSWRYSYYGDFLPNTYYAKVCGSLGDRLHSAWKLLLTFVRPTRLDVCFFALGILLAASVGKALKDRSLLKIPFEAVFAVAWLAYFFYIGGDCYEDRFLIILFPLGYFAIARVFARISHGLNDRKLKIYLGTLGVILLMLWADPTPAPENGGAFVDEYDAWAEEGKCIARNFPGASIAVVAAGKISYFNPDSYVIDMLGLNDKHIARVEPDRFIVAHSKRDNEYVLKKKPDIITGFIGPDGTLGIVEMTKDMWEKEYSLVRIGGKEKAREMEPTGSKAFNPLEKEEWEFVVLMRKDYLDTQLACRR